MKKIIIITTSIILLLAIAFGMYLLNGCQKDVESIEQGSNITAVNKIFGIILNSKTLLPEAGVKVFVNELETTESLDDGSFNIDLCNQDQINTITIKTQKNNFNESEVILSNPDLYYSIDGENRLIDLYITPIATNSNITHRSDPYRLEWAGEYLLDSGESNCSEALVLTWNRSFSDGKFGLTRTYSGSNTCLAEYKKKVVTRSVYVAKYKYVIYYKTSDDPYTTKEYTFYWPYGTEYYRPVYCNYENCHEGGSGN